jgi:hypothetical protein
MDSTTAESSDQLALRREWRRTRIIVWFAMLAVGTAACAMVWTGAMMMGIGRPDTFVMGQWMCGIGVAMVVLGCQVEL